MKQFPNLKINRRKSKGRNINIIRGNIKKRENDFYIEIDNKKYKGLKIAISKVTILRKRPGSNVPCDEHLENDDDKLKQQITSLIKCTPPYWRQGARMNSSNRICNSESKLQDLSIAQKLQF